MSDAPGANSPPPATGASRRRSLPLLGSALALTALIFGIILSFPQRAFASPPGGNVHNPAILNVDIARPAVVRIETGYRSVTITAQLCASENDVVHDPDGVAGLGSGAFISAHGDILTAGHVVSAPPGDFEVFVLQDPAVYTPLLSDIRAHCGFALTDTDLVNAYISDPSLLTFDFASPVNKVWLDTSYAGKYTQAQVRDVQFYPYTVKAVSNFETSGGGIGNDVAIIHINLDDTPSLVIGDSTGVQPTDTLTIIGYPGNGDSNHYKEGQPTEVPTDFLTSSINVVTVSAIKTNDGGGAVIQVGGNVEHGDSGGPALNDNGEIVGVVSFGGPDNPDGTSFFQATANATPLLAQANIDKTPGHFQTSWRQALTDYAATSSGHWHKAVTELTTLQAAYPQFKGAQTYLDYATKQAQTESTNQGLLNLDTNTEIGLGLAGVAVLALVAIVLVAVNGRKRARKKAALAALEAQKASANTYYGYGPPPQTGGQPMGAQPPAWQGGYPAPSPWQQPGAGSQQQSGWPPAPVATATASRPMCANGHPMQANEVYCGVCGAPRAQR